MSKNTLSAKEIISSCLPREVGLVNCRFGKINKETAFEVGESKEYVWGEKTFRVTVVKKSGEKFVCDNDATETFSGEGTFKNKENANAYVKDLKSRKDEFVSETI